jgi:glycerol-3-phosphate dehydrogenase
MKKAEQVNEIPFSANERRKWIQEAESLDIPLLIIGGGITGAGILLDASSRGIKTLLLEQDDFASGTSSKSTKLIHGGLRYLKNFEWGLVREVGRERSILKKIAPYLVKPSPMLLPLRKGGSLGRISARLAISLYEWLIGVNQTEKHRVLGLNQLLAEEPLLKVEGLLGGIVYTEYITDDARLTLEVLKTGIRHGGRAVNYCRVTSLEKKETYYVVHCEDLIEKKRFEIRTLQVVNATGPWVDKVRRLENSSEPSRLTLSKGIHLVIAKEKLPVRRPAYFDAPDGRMIFVIPRADACYAGTTDTIFSGDPSEVQTDDSDTDYLLNALHQVFNCTIDKQIDIVSNWAGLRPLLTEPGKSAGEISRKDEIIVSPDGMLSIAGGKLTGFRVMAKKVTDMVITNLGTGFTPCITEHIPLAGTGLEDPELLLTRLVAAYGTEKESRIRELIARYGSGSEWITRHSATNDWIQGEMQYCRLFEMAMKPDDFWLRRTSDAYFNLPRMTRNSSLNAEFSAF